MFHEIHAWVNAEALLKNCALGILVPDAIGGEDLSGQGTRWLGERGKGGGVFCCATVAQLVCAMPRYG